MGSKLLYYLVILPISRLPFWILYLLSDFLYLILYKIIGYRTKVVHTNIRNSFPEKTNEEVKAIESKFYAHLCDLVVESIKAFTISKEEAQRRMKDRNIDLVNQYTQKGKQLVMVGGHYGNWEMFAITIGIDMDAKALALYTPLKNKFFDNKIRNSRSKYGLEMLPIQEIKSKMAEMNDDLHTVIFGADQSPRKNQKAYWMNFLNQETGVQFGTEKFAMEYNAAVVFGNIYKIKRGFYEVQYDLICENAQETEYGFITRTHTKMLEKVIQSQPEYWLWSHKRWKHKRAEDQPLHL